MKDLNGYFPFEPPADPDEWRVRSGALRHRLATVLGLWPEPEKTPMNPVIHSVRDMGDYTVANVYFESVPGFFVTGNLYRPAEIEGKVPGILCPHGHWANGRFYDNGNVAGEIAIGAERFVDGGRSPMQSRCVQLARMGCIVFHFDMIGYADSVQISEDLAHRFARQRPHLATGEEWGFFSPKAEGLYQSIMGLQTWNSVRALDFLCGMPEVDQDRLAVTGASGGGTQSFLLAALDDRIDLSFPAVMVSTAMQGGCTCENASGLRIGTGNVEIAALFAPKPQGMTAANDWTVEMETKGFPQLRKLYQMMNAGDEVMLAAFTHFGHNYNSVSRTAMYGWVNRHFHLGQETPVLEKPYRLLTRDEMTVWNEDHPAPSVRGEEFETALLRRMMRAHVRNLMNIRDRDEKEFLGVLRRGWEVVVGRSWESAGNPVWKLTHKADRGRFLEMAGTVDNTTYDESLPVVFLYPKKEWNGRTILALSDRGKAFLYDGNGELMGDAGKYLEEGYTVLGVDLLFQGEFLPDGESHDQQRKVNNPREAAAYTQGYNDALCARRIHDVMTVIKFLRTYDKGPSEVEIIAEKPVAHIAMAASALAGMDNVASLRANPGDFRFASIDSIRDPDFLPGAIRFGDIRGLRILNGLEQR